MDLRDSSSRVGQSRTINRDRIDDAVRYLSNRGAIVRSSVSRPGRFTRDHAVYQSLIIFSRARKWNALTLMAFSIFVLIFR
jgi:hypothetical protein